MRLVTRRRHEQEVGHLQKQVETLTVERDYWKSKAEELIDAALVRAGAIHQPTMVPRRIPTGVDAASMIAAALSIQEIDSSKRKDAS